MITTKNLFCISVILLILTPIAATATANVNRHLSYIEGEVHLKGTNYINSVIVPVKDNIIITGDGIDSTILDFGNSSNGQIYFDARKNITIRNLTLKSANGISKSRLLFNNSKNIKLQNIKVNGGGKYFLNWAILFSTNNRNIIIDNVTTINTEDSPIRFYNKNGFYNSGIKITNYTNLGNADGHYQYGNGDGIDLYGVRDATLKTINIKNVGSNGIGIYADAKNIIGDDIHINNVGSGNKGSGIAIERWDNLDPSNIKLNSIKINQDWGHGIRLLSKKNGEISNITITNYQGDKIWWSGISLEGGSFSNILISNFNISNTNMVKGRFPVFYFNSASYKNVLIKKGQLVRPYIQNKYNIVGITMRDVRS